ncbi:3alpha(or 20beta)-hydroxysteroid dehydrogenase [Microbacterium sp. AK009]|uniref:glucose 1-dehydrogenase n=1 Tax=Microbacterium sp. AK009 TaxID=2723068 RepID=UPI0015CE09FA|nr:glucose 1-dehydrogenase [Microbacterium sp. AK009]NYF18216.1 3alpha(or 20beta)-hydroxysteroid dehydrogenase [Microbacterium sp. AK009]
MARFEDKTVLISGGAGGQGAAHLRAYIEEGANVVIGDIRDEDGAALAARCGPRAHYVHLDVTKEEDWAAAVTAAEERYGPLDVLVNNAGIPSPAVLIEDGDPATWREILDVNLTGQYLGIRAVVPSLRRNGGGAIVNIASMAADVGIAYLSPYVASKWGVRGLSQTAALELARYGIRVNAVHPGVVRTPFITEPAAPNEPPVGDTFSPDALAVKRLAEPDEISRIILYLTSADADFVTGADFVIDGGLLLGPVVPAEKAA